MKDKYTCQRLAQLKKIKGSELEKAFKEIGCDFCSGNYYDCKDYIPNYENKLTLNNRNA